MMREPHLDQGGVEECGSWRRVDMLKQLIAKVTVIKNHSEQTSCLTTQLVVDVNFCRQSNH
jgi:hypothetical protein